MDPEKEETFTITAFDLDGFLDFINSIGFQIEVQAHATFVDFSEMYHLRLFYRDKLVGSILIHYLDNHFWPKPEEELSLEESLRKVAKPREWGVIVEPVKVTIEEEIPSSLLFALRFYKDKLPPFDEAKKAYDQYIAKKS